MLTLFFFDFCSGRRAAQDHAIFFRGKDSSAKRKFRSWWAILLGLERMARAAQVPFFFQSVRFHLLLVRSTATLFYSNLLSLRLSGEGGLKGIPTTETMDQVKTIPYATRYISCAGPMNGECRKSGYNGVCWIDRPDVTPVKKQANPMPGRAK
jgi:hypothetical protein